MSEGKKFAAIFGLILALWTPVLLGARAVCRITSTQLANQELALPAVALRAGLRARDRCADSDGFQLFFYSWFGGCLNRIFRLSSGRSRRLK